jgi:ABC-type nitrate/sulfonate/bicarbonate transport system substrate-binding protein
MRAKLATSVLAALGALTLTSTMAAAKVTIAIGGAGCLCYPPAMLAERLCEYQRAGVAVEFVNFKDGTLRDELTCAAMLLDEEVVSASSAKTIRRPVVRKPQPRG